MLEDHVLVVGLHLRWDGVWQRPQHILSRLSRYCPVIVVEEPVAAARDFNELLTRGSVTIVRAHRCAISKDEPLDGSVISLVGELLGKRQPIVWLYTPMMTLLAGAFGKAPLVFDCMDALAAFAEAPRGLSAREALLLSQADLVFAGGPTLFRKRAHYGAKVRLYASGVDEAFFARAADLPPHDAMGALHRPIFGYVGVIDERIDLPLIADLADATSGSVAMIGPTAKIDPRALPRRANIAHLGQRAYEELPAFLSAFDVALMPFALNESTVSISPTKTLEYLAAGLPVVSTAVPDVVAGFADVVTVAGGRRDFVNAALDAVAARRFPAAGRRRAREASWDAVVGGMRGDLEALLAGRSASHLSPFSQPVSKPGTNSSTPAVDLRTEPGVFDALLGTIKQ